MCKKILLINPSKDDSFQIGRIHMGLTLLGNIIKAEGNDVKVMDYAFLRTLKGRLSVPSIDDVVGEFKPHIIGITVYTYCFFECEKIIKKVSQVRDRIIMLGGPHFIMFPDDFSNDKRIDYIFRGEAEEEIANCVKRAKKEGVPKKIECKPVNPDKIPPVNLDIAYGSKLLTDYQIQLSRGCPFHCIFCNIKLVAGRRVRFRDIDICIQQIIEAKKAYPYINKISITDDVPTINKIRFMSFLNRLKEADIGCDLAIDNVRADLIDNELIKLYKYAGGQNICLGVESGHPEVFKNVKKGEGLEEIVKAAHMIKDNGLTLGLCFVIGLIGDNYSRHLRSVKFAKSLSPHYIFWNMAVPWPNTELREWYSKYGVVGNLRDFTTLIDQQGNYHTPPASSSNFNTEDMIKAWFLANLETYQFSLSSIPNLLKNIYKYSLYKSFFVFLIGRPFHIVSFRCSITIRYFNQYGFKVTFKKVISRLFNTA